MAFTRKQAIAAQAIWGIRVVLSDPDPDDINQQTARVEVNVRMNDGSVQVVRANLANHLSGAQLTALRNLMADIRAKANAEILPE